MPSIYVSEPPTKGKVILNTTYGPLDIKLWPKEAPKAVRNFVQLCLEGYYDNTIYHRIIKIFLVQGGDPTVAGTVACANAGRPHSNGGQFFISLERCDWPDKKNTISGKITGDSVFNLLSLGEAETNKDDDRPLDPPPRITSVEVPWNPFEDIIPKVPSKSSIKPETENKDSKKKAEKEAEEEEKQLAATKQKTKSSHDVLNDPHLLKEENPSKELNSSEGETTRDVQLSVKEPLSSKKGTLSMKEAPGSKKEAPRRDSAAVFSNSDDDDEDDALFYSGMHQQIIKKGKELGDLPPKLKQNAKLEKLRKALSTKADASNNESGVADNEDLSDWGTIRLTFAPERGKDGMSRKEDPNDYVVHDPLLEKGKEKFNQMRAKQKRQEREWAGKPLA